MIIINREKRKTKKNKHVHSQSFVGDGGGANQWVLGYMQKTKTHILHSMLNGITNEKKVIMRINSFGSSHSLHGRKEHFRFWNILLPFSLSLSQQVMNE